MFMFRLNCLYIQHLKYILFCCTLVSKCIHVDFNDIKTFESLIPVFIDLLILQDTWCESRRTGTRTIPVIYKTLV